MIEYKKRQTFISILIINIDAKIQNKLLAKKLLWCKEGMNK